MLKGDDIWARAQNYLPAIITSQTWKWECCLLLPTLLWFYHLELYTKTIIWTTLYTYSSLFTLPFQPPNRSQRGSPYFRSIHYNNKRKPNKSNNWEVAKNAPELFILNRACRMMTYEQGLKTLYQQLSHPKLGSENAAFYYQLYYDFII